MLLVIGYASKKKLKESIGSPLVYRETSVHGPEYKDNGLLTVAHRPALGYLREGREFFANVTMKDGLIEKVA